MMLNLEIDLMKIQKIIYRIRKNSIPFIEHMMQIGRLIKALEDMGGLIML
ncbi:hypothetical protein NEI02_10405 [Brachyspira pilosicoli]|nr:hypothetical protein [Brachyspira pilosicoli]WIH90104.1 hypothetical protein NEI02_10405 [Brachyspira pilosicoli]